MEEEGEGVHLRWTLKGEYYGSTKGVMRRPERNITLARTWGEQQFVLGEKQ